MKVSDDKNTITTDDGTVLRFEARDDDSCDGCYYHGNGYACRCVPAPCTPASHGGREDGLTGIFKEVAQCTSN